MKFINKKTHLQEGHTITDEYLTSECRVNDDAEHYHYQNVDYDASFRSSGAKERMLRLALANQNNYCCYCMRDLGMHDPTVTLEHIIPQRCTADEFSSYVNLNIYPLIKGEVVRTRDFTGVQAPEIPPRPHTVSFENLTASCDGTFPDRGPTSQCCNSKRGNRFVFPMFYIEGVENDIVYMENGTMQIKESCAHAEDYRKTIRTANLNCRNLKYIRRLWYLFADIPYGDLENCVNDENKRMEKLRQVLYLDNDMTDQDNDIFNKFKRENYWRTFMMYHWFYRNS